jgi:hypothetical protein
MFVFCRRYNAANPNTLPTMIQGQAFSINLTIPIMRTFISISCERALFVLTNYNDLNIGFKCSVLTCLNKWNENVLDFYE